MKAGSIDSGYVGKHDGVDPALTASMFLKHKTTFLFEAALFDKVINGQWMHCFHDVKKTLPPPHRICEY